MLKSDGFWKSLKWAVSASEQQHIKTYPYLFLKLRRGGLKSITSLKINTNPLTLT